MVNAKTPGKGSKARKAASSAVASPVKKRASRKTTVAAKKRPAATRDLIEPVFYPPTLGDIDLHLFGEGRHERIYDKLGAHVIAHEGVKGVSFAVWAPNAERVSVVGDFNSWDGTKNQMRRLGDSGVWEIFIPKLNAGELYKYEIKSHGLRSFLKADPYARLRRSPACHFIRGL